MKPRFLSICFLLGSYCFAQGTVTTEESPDPEVRITSPGDPDFHEVLHQLLGDGADSAEELSPFLLIVKNVGHRTVVAYTAVWRITSTSGPTSDIGVSYVYPRSIAGKILPGDIERDKELLPGETRVVSLRFEVSDRTKWPNAKEEFARMAKRQAEEIGEVKSVKAGLDAVIFDDGEIVGPDNHRLAPSFAQYVNAYQILYRQIVTAARSGADPDVIAATIGTMLEKDKKAEIDRVDRNSSFRVIAEEDVLKEIESHHASVDSYFARLIREPQFLVSASPRKVEAK
jgi:hypothetical protein